MRAAWGAAGLLVVAAGVGGPAVAEAGVGAGRSSSSIVVLPATPGAKPLGKASVAPKDFKPGGAPQGALFKFKFNLNVGDPLKPGLTPGRYIIEIDAPASPEEAPAVNAFTTFTYTADKKCTIDPNPSVIPPDGGFPGPGGCGEIGEPLCDGPHVGKCEMTQYQAAGTFFYSVIGDAVPLQLIGRIRSLAPAHDVGGSEGLCETGTLDLTGDDDPNGPCVGGAGTNPTPNPVIGVIGIAAGADDNP